MYGPSGLSRTEREAIAVCARRRTSAITEWSSTAPRCVANAARPALAEAVACAVRPWAMTRADVERLRRADLSDRDVVDVNQVVSYFNYVNRVDGLGVELEADWLEHLRAANAYGIRARADGIGEG